jgi:hypothetical protein
MGRESSDLARHLSKTANIATSAALPASSWRADRFAERRASTTV